MSSVTIPVAYGNSLADQSASSPSVDDLSGEIRVLLSTFDGEDSLKRLFWELLSYDRVRDPLPLTFLPPSASQFVATLEVFADSEAYTIVLATVRYVPLGGLLEQMAWAVKRNIPNCILLLEHASTWSVVYPDEVLKPRVRILALPGTLDGREETIHALAVLNAADEDSGEDLSVLELAQGLDASFPGATPNIGDLLTDFKRIEEHPDPEMREMWPFIKAAGQYPLLSPAQERGDDLRGDERPPDDSELTYHQWRLVVHNLRLVVWIAGRYRGLGLDLADLVQEGTLGLMKAARRFDPFRGNRFTTIGFWWVRQRIARAVADKGTVIRWPVHRFEQLSRAAGKKLREGLSAGEIPPIGGRFLYRIPGYVESDPFDGILNAEIISAVNQVVGELRPIHREVITRRFGLESGEAETLDQIGQEFGLTRERIRQIEAKGLKKLRHYRRTTALEPYVEAVNWRSTHCLCCLRPYDNDHPFGLSTSHRILPQVGK
jgi:RNA polymerase primary sigma factor